MVNNNYETRYDVFHSYLVRTATYAGEEEFPAIKSCNEIPNKIVPFSVAMKSSYKDFDFGAGIHFLTAGGAAAISPAIAIGWNIRFYEHR